MVGHLAAQAVAAQDEGVAILKRMRTFDIDLDERLGPQGAQNAIARNVMQRLRLNTLPTGQLPLPTVIKRQLLDDALPNPVCSAIANVSYPGALRPQEQGGGGCSHALEFWVLLTAAMDAGVGFLKGVAQSSFGPFVGVLVVGVRDDVDGQLGRHFTDRMAAHAIRHEEDMPAVLPLLLIAGEQHSMRILLMAAAHADVSHARVFDLVVTRYHQTPWAELQRSLAVCYTTP